MSKRLTVILMLALACACSRQSGKVRLNVVNPGHFHAAMVLRQSLPGVSDTVNVYSEGGDGLDSWLSSVERFNGREANPTSWYVRRSKVLPPAQGGREVVILAGDNARKSELILDAVRKGYDVLSDKPMALNFGDMALLRKAYSGYRLIMDLMTERYDEVNVATRRALSLKSLSGGSPEEPGIAMESVHHFYKEVDGVPLQRPAWYYDVRHQGEGIADVTTHLIDLIMWQCFPDEAITPDQVEVLSASHYATPVTLEQFEASTGMKSFPSYLSDFVTDGVLRVYSNGSILVKIRNIFVTIAVRWDFEGGPDTFSATYHCDDGDIRVLQDSTTGYTRKLLERERDITPSVTLTHEDHFSMVLADFLRYVRGEVPMPEWERQNTLTKYFITTTAVSMAND